MDAPDLAKGIAAGLVGGLAATWVMTKLQTAIQSAASDDDEDRQDAGSGDGEEGEEQEPATAEVADRVARATRGRELEGKTKERASNAVHYGFGTLAGGAFGALAEAALSDADTWEDAVGVELPGDDRIDGYGGDVLAGLGWGAGLWLLGDEVAVPALRLAPPPWKTPASEQASMLGAHLVYGATLGVVRRLVRTALA